VLSLLYDGEIKMCITAKTRYKLIYCIQLQCKLIYLIDSPDTVGLTIKLQNQINS